MEITIEVIKDGETYAQRFPSVENKLEVQELLEVIKKNLEDILDGKK